VLQCPRNSDEGPDGYPWDLGSPFAIEVYSCASPDGIEKFLGWISEMPVDVRIAYTLRFIQD